MVVDDDDARANTIKGQNYNKKSFLDQLNTTTIRQVSEISAPISIITVDFRLRARLAMRATPLSLPIKQCALHTI